MRLGFEVVKVTYSTDHPFPPINGRDPLEALCALWEGGRQCGDTSLISSYRKSEAYNLPSGVLQLFPNQLQSCCPSLNP